MKRKLLFGFVAAFLFASIGVAQIEFKKTDNNSTVLEMKDEGDWLHYDTGESTGKVGLGGDPPVEWVSAIMFPAEDLTAYDGFEITEVRVYVADMPISLSAVFYTGDEDDFTEIYSQPFADVTAESWNVVTLNIPVEIDASENLWIGIHVTEDGDGIFPIGTDANAPEADGLGNWAGWVGDDGFVWNKLSAFGIDGVWMIGGLAVGETSPGDFHPVTFILNMTGAVAEDDIVFDPAVHDVYVTGTFTGWAEPGSDEAFKLVPYTDNKGPSKAVLYEEHFSPAVEDGALPEGWTQKKADNPIGLNLVDLVGDGFGEGDDTRWWRYSELFPMYASGFNADWVHTEDASMHINWNVEAEENVYAISPTIELIEAENTTLEFWMFFDGSWYTELNVLIEMDEVWEVLAEFNTDDHENLYEAPVHIDLSGRVGDARIAFVYKWTDGIQMNIDAIKVTAVNELYYTITLDAEEADHEYKYFLVEDEPTWGIGEWAGDPNRSLTVEGPMTVEDIFGEYEEENFIPSISEDGFAVYPNPARDIMNVVSDSQINSLRIFDLSGRLVFSQSYNASQVTMDVSSFNYGLYIMQIATETGIKNVKISVTK